MVKRREELRFLLCIVLVAATCWRSGAKAAPGEVVNYGRSTIQGGSGGGPFRIVCEPNQYMTGITVHSGGWIDSVAVECGFLSQQGDRFSSGAPRVTTKGGGNGGSERRAGCDPNQHVSGIKFGFTRDGNRPKYLDYVQISCQRLQQTGNNSTRCLDSGGNGCWDRHPSPGPYNGFGLAFEAYCGASSFAVGLSGRSGDYIDALAIECLPKPRS